MQLCNSFYSNINIPIIYEIIELHDAHEAFVQQLPEDFDPFISVDIFHTFSFCNRFICHSAILSFQPILILIMLDC